MANDGAQATDLYWDSADDAPSPEPPSVYPAHSSPEQWFVEAPPGRTTPQGDRMVFSGPNAQVVALIYAYESFGNARLFLTSLRS